MEISAAVTQRSPLNQFSQQFACIICIPVNLGHSSLTLLRVTFRHGKE